MRVQLRSVGARIAERRALWRTGAGIAATGGLLWLVIVLAPPWFVADQTLEGLKVQNEVRATLLQGLAGALLTAGAYLTFRQLKATHEGQITDRYTRAIDQLGHAHVDVRLGGIYALERIARDSPSDRKTIGEILIAFVRGHAPWPPSQPGQPDAKATAELGALRDRAPDVQAIVTVLGRGGFSKQVELDLMLTDLRGVDLQGLHMERARLTSAHLEGAFAWDAHLEGAQLQNTHLEETSFDGVHLEHATLDCAHLQEATLYRAHLEGASFTEAHLEGAHIVGAEIHETTFAGAYLGAAYLDAPAFKSAVEHGAQLQGAILVEDDQVSATSLLSGLDGVAVTSRDPMLPPPDA